MNTQTPPTTISQIRDMFLNDEITSDAALDYINTISGAGIHRNGIRLIYHEYLNDPLGLNTSVIEKYPHLDSPILPFSYMTKILYLYFS